jgi:hypothetical protein
MSVDLSPEIWNAGPTPPVVRGSPDPAHMPDRRSPTPSFRTAASYWTKLARPS